MKNRIALTFLSFLFLLGITSCEKNYRCVCDVDAYGSQFSTYSSVKAKSTKEAEKACADLDGYWENDPLSNVKCRLE